MSGEYAEVRPGLRRCADLLPSFFILAGLAAEIFTPEHVLISALFAAAPVAAAALQGMCATILTSCLAVALTVVMAFAYHADDSLYSRMTELSVVVVSLMALLLNYVMRRSGRRLASARMVSESIQLAVVPTPPARVDGCAVAARYQAARAGPGIGGDFYVAQPTPFGVRLLIGDVRGKGLGAVEAVVIITGAFREAAEQEPTLTLLAQRLERALQREGSRQKGEAQLEGFTTALLAEVPAGRPGVLRLLNRGHPPPFLVYDGTVRTLSARVPNTPLGMSQLGEWPEHPEETDLPPHALLLLYTDGLSEARDADGVFYPVAERLAELRFADAQELVDGLVEDVAAYTGGGTTDDMAMLVLERLPEAAACGKAAEEERTGREEQQRPKGGGARAEDAAAGDGAGEGRRGDGASVTSGPATAGGPHGSAGAGE